MVRIRRSIRGVDTALAVAVLAPAVFTPVSARANVFEIFGAGARSQAMAGAVTATATDFGAVWHNPAGLAYAPDSASFGMTGAFDRTSILLAPRPQGYDPTGYGLRLNERRDTDKQGSLFGVTLGLTMKLVSDDLRIGFLVYMPSDGFAHAAGAFPDEREQYFDNRLHYELLGERLRSEIMAAGLGYRLADWLSLGFGMKMLQSNETVTRVYTPNAADPSKVYMATGLQQQTGGALIAGAMVQPWPFLRIGLSFHDELAFKIKGESEVQIRGQESEDDYPLVQPIRQVQHASVPRFGFGAAYTGDAWTAGLDATYEIWSRYPSVTGDLAHLKNTYSVSGGFEYELRKGTHLRSGLGWHPSPVPDQTGRTNFVDNNRIVASLGAGNAFKLWERNFEANLGVQVQALLARETVKHVANHAPVCDASARSLCDEVPDSKVDTPVLPAADTVGLQTGNPGFPGFSSGGYILTAGLDVRWLF